MTDEERSDESEVEWGVWLDWPNGYRDVQSGLGEVDARRMAAWHNDSGQSVCVASIVTREVTYSEWTPVYTEASGVGGQGE